MRSHRHPLVFAVAGGGIATTALALASVLEVAPQSIDTGGRRVASANYTIDATVGGVLGVATGATPVIEARQGYVAQLFEVQSLAVGGPLTVDENATALFSASATLDDGTTLAVPAAQATWSFTGAGQSVAPTGELTAATVYEDSAARVNAAWRGRTGGADLLVLDTLRDNFGSYANDGLRDQWQIQQFGPDNPLAAPTAVPFGDGVTNQLKHAWNVAAAATGGAPTVTIADGHLALVFRRLKSAVAPRPTYVVQVSADLATWLDNTSPGAPFTTELSAVSLDADTELVTVRDNTPLTAEPRRFIRLQVSRP